MDRTAELALPTGIALPTLHRKVLPETALVALVCVLDAVSTVYLVHHKLAIEGNPILAWTFQYGSLVFLIVKYLTFIPPLMIMEHMREKHPKLIRLALRVTFVGYLLLYGGLSLILNAVMQVVR